VSGERDRALKLYYKYAAVVLAVLALAVLIVPDILFSLVDDVSARVNGTNIWISFFVFVIWALVTLLRLSATRPGLADWPRPHPLWLGVVWLALCVSYTGFEHGWFAYPEFVYEEDGIFEVGTALALLACAAFFLVSASGRAWRLSRGLSAATVALAVLCLLLFLEEISWGQRIFDWDTPEESSTLNAQQETNLHNMFVGYNQLIRLVIALAISSALLGRQFWLHRLSGMGLGELVPVPATVYFVPFLIFSHTYDELFEEVVGLFLVVYAFNLYGRLSAARANS